MDSENSQKIWNRWGLLLLPLLLLFSFVLRFHALSLSSFWIDEMVSLNLAKHSLWKSVFWDNNPPLYLILLKLWTHAFGDSEQAARSLSVLFSVGTTAVLMRIGYESRGLRGAVCLGLLHAVNWSSVAFAQEARMYALFEFTSAVSLLYFLRLNRGASIRAEWGFGISAFVIASAHYLAFIPVGLEAFWLVIRGRKKSILICAAVGLLLVLSVEGSFYLNFFKWDALGWQNLKFFAEPTSLLPRQILEEWCNYSVGVAICFALLFLFGIWKTVEMPEALHEGPFENLFLFIFILTPLVVMPVSSFFAHRSILVSRYFIFIIPSLLLFLGKSWLDLFDLLWSSRRKFVRIFAVGFVLLLFLGWGRSASEFYKPYKEPWRDVADLVNRYPKAPIFTTRTVAIGVPYFERIGFSVSKFDPQDRGMVSLFTQGIAQSGRVWVIENYWGGYGYMPEFKNRMDKLGFEVSELSVRTEYSSPVLVMMIERKGQNVLAKTVHP